MYMCNGIYHGAVHIFLSPRRSLSLVAMPDVVKDSQGLEGKFSSSQQVGTSLGDTVYYQQIIEHASDVMIVKSSASWSESANEWLLL